jgi:hypothetical protein
VFSSAVTPILDSGLVNAMIDGVAVLEFAIFDYALGNKTFFKEIKMLDYGRILKVNSRGVEQERYFFIDQLFQNEMHNRRDSLQLLHEILHENANLYVSDASDFLLALTGGFDCRMNLSLIDRPIREYMCYAYGMPGSLQLLIPQEIAKRLGINFEPIVLDEHFEEKYEECALRALFYSDGTAPILRANYPYAYMRLREFSGIALTGLFGSEILRPLRDLGLQVNENSKRLLTSNNFDEILKEICNEVKGYQYLRGSLFDDNYDELREHIWKDYIAPRRDNGVLQNFYNFFIEEGIRKYFMQEIRIERVYVETRIPYFDVDFVSLIYSTPFAGLCNGALRYNPTGRRRAQALYSYVIKKHRPLLGEIITDRGYRPNDLLSRFWFLKIMPGYLRSRLYYSRVGNDTFDAERWTDIVFSNYFDLMKKETEVFNGTFYRKYRNKENISNNYYFSRMFSVHLWLSNVLQ